MRRLLALLHLLLLLLMFLLHLLCLLLMPLFRLLFSRVIGLLLIEPLMFLVLFLLQLLPLLVLLLIHLFLFLLVFLVRLWISGVGRSIRPVRLRQFARVNVIGPVGIVILRTVGIVPRTVRVVFRPARIRSTVVRATIRWRIVLASFSCRHHRASA